MNSWYYAHSAQTFGPVTKDQLVAMIQTGQLMGEHFIMREGADEWQVINASPFSGYLPPKATMEMPAHFAMPAAPAASPAAAPRAQPAAAPRPKKSFIRLIYTTLGLIAAALSWHFLAPQMARVQKSTKRLEGEALKVGSENVAFSGKLWNITNNRLMRSRFETCLTTPEAISAEDQAYRDLMAQIMDLLAATHKPQPEPMKALALLPEAATYKIDGGLCNAIADSIKGITEIEARKKLNEAASGPSEVTSKVQFQALIIQMFLQRRFEHVVIACRFYPNLFKDGDSTLHLDKDSDLRKALSGSFGVPPTVTMIDSLSLDAMRGVDESLVSFENLVSRRQNDNASNRLLEAFAIGEYLPRVRRLPMTEKCKVLDYLRKKNKLLGFMEMKDYANAAIVVSDLRSLSEDFEYTKPLATIQTARSVSSLHIAKARLAMAQKDTKTLEVEMKAASEIWPTNPDLASFSGEMLKAQKSTR